MADRTVENYSPEIPPMPEGLQRTLIDTLDQGKQKLADGDELVPFTVINVKGNYFTELHPGNSTEECYAMAKHTVEGARGASAYALCYDGYLETDDGMKDAVIVEGGMPGESKGFALGYLYTVDGEGKPKFNTNPSYIGYAPNFMADLKKESSEHPDVDMGPDADAADGDGDADAGAATENGAQAEQE